MNRREFIRILGAVVSTKYLTGCKEDEPEGELPLPDDVVVVDVHSHVFNAYDLPVDGFLEYVGLNELAGTPSASLIGIIAGAITVVLGKPFTREKILLEQMLGDVPTGKSVNDLKTQGAQIDAQKEQVYAEQINQGFRKILAEPKTTADHDAFVRELKRQLGGLPEEKVTPLNESFDYYTALKASKREWSRYIGWGLKLLEFRYRHVEDLKRYYKNVNLFTPALVDFDRWLYPSQDSDEPINSLTTVDRQMHLMELIGRLNKGSVHPFVAFDPRREAEEGRALDWVKTAVEQQGAMGVKLYPPMGFAPLGNADDTLCRAPRGLAEKINQALHELYGWCAENSVPVMAHTADTNYNRICGDLYRRQHWAHPRYWASVLKQYPGLRLNLGHFASHTLPNQGWTPLIRDLMLKYEHVYADLSHIEQLSDPAYTREFFAGLSAFFEGAPGPEARKTLMQRLMYGSDWIMLAKEVVSPRYFNHLVSQYAESFGDGVGSPRQVVKDFIGENAIRYLGLRLPQVRERFEKLYARWGLDELPAWYARTAH